MKESQLQKRCLKWIKDTYGKSVLAVNIHGGGWGNKGFPDIIVFSDGHAIVCELKSKDTGYTLQPDQEIWRRRFTYANVPHYIPTTLEEFQAIIQKEFNHETNRNCC